MEFGLVGLVELRIKAGLVRFRIGRLGCAFLGFKARLVRLGWLRVGFGYVWGAVRVWGGSGQV